MNRLSKLLGASTFRSPQGLSRFCRHVVEKYLCNQKDIEAALGAKNFAFPIRLFITIVYTIYVTKSVMQGLFEKPETDLSSVSRRFWKPCLERRAQLHITSFVNVYKERHNEWRVRTNQEIEALIKEENIVRFIKSQRLAWYGHVNTRWFKYDRDDLCVNKPQFVPVIFEPPCRMEENKNVKAIMKWNPIDRRSRGRPKTRWKDDVEADLRAM
jgi:hypothetical protein